MENNMYEKMDKLFYDHSNKFKQIKAIELMLEKTGEHGTIIFPVNSNIEGVILNEIISKGALVEQGKRLKVEIKEIELKIIKEIELIHAKQEMIKEAIETSEQASFEELFGETE